MNDINEKTKVYALLGNPVEHSLSPVMYNAAFRELGLNSVYVAFNVEPDLLAEAVQGIRAQGIQGGNVTRPFKEAILPYLDELSVEARLIGAVNTFYWEEGCLWGDNTDGAGFIVALRRVDFDFSPSQSVLLLGAGGAARAVGVALALAGMKNFTIVNRQREKAENLAKLLERLGGIVSLRNWEGANLREVFSENKLVVNTTPLGMTAVDQAGPPIEEKWFVKGQLVVDLIYNPLETEFLKKAAARGCQTLNGLSTLWAQGVLAFERWTKKEAPAEVMATELQRWL
ncbi:MAG TPA: shikimate dehydrogenase [Clostridia bacterium]|jgi:shikimate dehydrogenase|nr:shikimate dehydrogenase [Clostridia bacterium]